MNKKQKIFNIILLILLVTSFILFRIENNIANTVGLILFPLIVIVGFLMLKEDK